MFRRHHCAIDIRSHCWRRHRDSRNGRHTHWARKNHLRTVPSQRHLGLVHIGQPCFRRWCHRCRCHCRRRKLNRASAPQVPQAYPTLALGAAAVFIYQIAVISILQRLAVHRRRRCHRHHRSRCQCHRQMHRRHLVQHWGRCHRNRYRHKACCRRRHRHRKQCRN